MNIIKSLFAGIFLCLSLATASFAQVSVPIPNTFFGIAVTGDPSVSTATANGLPPYYINSYRCWRCDGAHVSWVNMNQYAGVYQWSRFDKNFVALSGRKPTQFEFTLAGGASFTVPYYVDSNGGKPEFNTSTTNGSTAVVDVGQGSTGYAGTVHYISSIADGRGTNKIQRYGQYVTDVITHMNTYYGSGTLKYLEPWNEVNTWDYPTSTLSGFKTQETADIALISQTAYANAKAIDPSIIVESPSITASGNSLSHGIPLSYFFNLEQLLMTCNGAVNTCFDVVNMHYYVPSVLGTYLFGSPNYANNYIANRYVTRQPEMLNNVIRNTKAVMNSTGFGSYPLYMNEGYIGETNPETNSENDKAAADNAIAVILMAANGVQHYNFHQWNNTDTTKCLATPVACFTASGNYVMGMSKTGVALRTVNSWLYGSTFTSLPTRTRGTNLNTTDVSTSSALGLISGDNSHPCGQDGYTTLTTGSKPAGWAISNGRPAEVNMYLNAIGTSPAGTKYARVRICSVTGDTFDTNYSNGKFNFLITSTYTGVPPQADVTFGMKLAKVRGSTDNLYQFEYKLNQRTSTPTAGSRAATWYQWVYPTSDTLDNQEYEFRSRQTFGADESAGAVGGSSTVDAGANIIQGFLLIDYYTATDGSKPFDITLDIGAPYMETGSNQWTANITGADGNARQIAWDANAISMIDPTSSVKIPVGTSTLSTSYTYWRDIYNVQHKVVSGQVTLSNSPILLENQVQKVILPL